MLSSKVLAVPKMGQPAPIGDGIDRILHGILPDGDGCLSEAAAAVAIPEKIECD